MVYQGSLGLKPLGTFCAIMTAQTRKILGSLGLLPLGKMLWREQICLYLVDISVHIINILLVNDQPDDNYLVFLRVFVMVFLFVTPMILTLFEIIGSLEISV